jgi:hypothetical protein
MILIVARVTYGHLSNPSKKNDEAICFDHEALHNAVAYLLIRSSDSHTMGGCNHN